MLKDDMRNSSIMTELMNELNACLRDGLTTKQEEWARDAYDAYGNKIEFFKSWEDFVNAIPEDGTNHIFALVVSKPKSKTELEAEKVMEKAARDREMKNKAQRKRRALKLEAEAAARAVLEAKETIVVSDNDDEDDEEAAAATTSWNEEVEAQALAAVRAAEKERKLTKKKIVKRPVKSEATQQGQ